MQSASGGSGEGAPGPAATGAAARAADARASFGGDGVQRALDILSIHSVRQAPLSQRIAVLESQGFSEKEISVAMQLADNIAQQQKAVAPGDGPGPGPAVLMHPAGGGGGGSTPPVVIPKEEGVPRHAEEVVTAPVFQGVGSDRAEEAAVAEGRWQALQPPASFNEGRSAQPWLAPVPGMQPPHVRPPPPQEQQQNLPSSSAASIYAGTAPWPLPHVQQHQQPQRVVVPPSSSGPVEDRASDAAFAQLLAQQWQEQQQQQQQQQQHQLLQQRHYASPQRFHQRQQQPPPPPQQQAQGGGYAYRGPRPPPFPQQQQQYGTGYVPQHAQHPIHQGGRDFSPLHQQHLVQQQRAGLAMQPQPQQPQPQQQQQQQQQQQHLHYAGVQQGMRHRTPLPAHRYLQQPPPPSRLPQGEGGEQMLAARLLQQQQQQQQAAAAAGGRMVGVGAEDGLLDAAELAMLAAEGHGAFPLGLGFPRHARRREAKRLRKAAIVAAGSGPGGLMPPLGMMGNPYAMVDGSAPAPFDPTALVLTSLQQQQQLQQELQEQQAMQQRHQAAAAAAAMPLNPALAGAAMLPPDDALPWYKTIASGRVQKHLMRFMNNFISQKDLEDELGLYMGDVFYETETGPTMAALYDKLERRVAERCPSHLRAFRAEALVSLAQLMAACEEREEQQERGREALKISGQRGKPVRNAAKRLGKSRTEARKLGAMIAHYRALTLREDAQAEAGGGQDRGGREEAARALEGDTKADGKERPPGLPSPSAAAAGVASSCAAAAAAAKAGDGEEEEEAGALLAGALAGLGLGGMKGPPQSCEPSPDETTMALLSSSSSCCSSSSSSLSGAA